MKLQKALRIIITRQVWNNKVKFSAWAVGEKTTPGHTEFTLHTNTTSTLKNFFIVTSFLEVFKKPNFFMNQL